jgi:hypothetical protein
MQKKKSKISKSAGELENKIADQALVRYIFSKESELINKGVVERMQDFIERESKKIPSTKSVKIDLNCSSSDLMPILQQLIPFKVEVQSLLTDSSMVGTTFLDELFESKNHGYSSLQLSNIGDVYNQGQHPELMENSRISRILPVHEQSNELEESSGLLRQLDLDKDSFGNSEKKRSKSRLSGRKNKLSDIKWKMQNFFESDSKFQLLHFFEPKSKNFYYIDLDTLESQKNHLMKQGYSEINNPPLEIFNKKQISQINEIPRHHKSICIPEDCIIITGGLEETEESKSN